MCVSYQIRKLRIVGGEVSNEIAVRVGAKFQIADHTDESVEKGNVHHTVVQHPGEFRVIPRFLHVVLHFQHLSNVNLIQSSLTIFSLLQKNRARNLVNKI